MTLQEWRDAHPTVRCFDLDRIINDFDCQVQDLVAMLDAAIVQGKLEMVLKLKDNDGTFIGGDYDSHERIPEKVEDRMCQNWVDTCDLQVVTAYRWVQ